MAVMRAPLFRAMGPDITRSIVQNRIPRHYERSDRIFQQGIEPTPFFWWSKAGSSSTGSGGWRTGRGGHFRRGRHLRGGSNVSGARYPASAEAVSPARILRIDGGALRRAIERKPQLAFDMLAAASVHLKQLVEQIEQLKARSAPSASPNSCSIRSARRSGPAEIGFPTKNP